MLYQPAPLAPVMTHDLTLNRNIFRQQAWLIGNRLEYSVKTDFVTDPKNGAWIYAPGSQNLEVIGAMIAYLSSEHAKQE